MRADYNNNADGEMRILNDLPLHKIQNEIQSIWDRNQKIVNNKQ